MTGLFLLKYYQIFGLSEFEDETPDYAENQTFLRGFIQIQAYSWPWKHNGYNYSQDVVQTLLPDNSLWVFTLKHSF